ncbi:MAG: alpha/beta hydrolase [Chitinophagaceae bacterium]|nr:alpha/beta hydrolase [Chitinophagaceae bacterium]
MKKSKPRKRLRSIITWSLWVLLAQFILINISAALYAHKLTHLYTPDEHTWTKSASDNIFTKTWRLFTGPKFYHQYSKAKPTYAFTTLTLKTTSGIPLEAWHAKTDSVTPKGTVILFHGLMGNKGQLLHEAEAFRNFGFNVMLLDVRGHGNSGGNVITIGYREAEEVKLAYDYVKSTGEQSIFIWGSSMGAVEVVKAVAEYPLQPSGIIIEMPFLSLQSHLKGRARILGFPEQPFGFLTSFWIGVERGFNGNLFNTARYAKKLTCPVLMQYGRKDELVLQYETDAIYSAIGSTNKKLVIYENAPHSLFLKEDPELWKSEVGDFLEMNR